MAADTAFTPDGKAPHERAEAAYDLPALLNSLDARIASQLAGA